VFTTNRVSAAPVRWCRALVPDEGFRGIVVNAGNANAATGPQGDADTRATAERASERLHCTPEQILVASTGVIGQSLPIKRMLEGIDEACASLSDEPRAFEAASRAMMTTDREPKLVSLSQEIDGEPVRLLGMAKGAAMISPNMGTMLVFLLTDARIAPGALQGVLTAAVDESFHCLSIDGDTSTNDTVLVLSRAGKDKPALHDAGLRAFGTMLKTACIELARLIAADAEGATHRITVEVRGAVDDGEARQVARAVASSLLVKTAIHGADPNWGRILMAAGAAGVAFEESELTVKLQEVIVFDRGAPVPYDAAKLSQALRDHRDISIELVFHTGGNGRATFWTSDLTQEYVRLNAEYTT
jgi:glutamate N-acetyltransferase/amino-acid N-acetyltransferase